MAGDHSYTPPRICVPVTGPTLDAALSDIKQAIYERADIIEIRADLIQELLTDDLEVVGSVID